MRKDVKWTVIGVVSIIIVIKIWAYIPHATSQSRGEIICIKSGGEVIERTINKDKDFLVFQENTYILTCYTPKTNTIALVDTEGKYLCIIDENLSNEECFDMATQKPIRVWNGE